MVSNYLGKFAETNRGSVRVSALLQTDTRTLVSIFGGGGVSKTFLKPSQPSSTPELPSGSVSSSIWTCAWHLSTALTSSFPSSARFPKLFAMLCWFYLLSVGQAPRFPSLPHNACSGSALLSAGSSDLLTGIFPSGPSFPTDFCTPFQCHHSETRLGYTWFPYRRPSRGSLVPCVTEPWAFNTALEFLVRIFCIISFNTPQTGLDAFIASCNSLYAPHALLVVCSSYEILPTPVADQTTFCQSLLVLTFRDASQAFFCDYRSHLIPSKSGLLVFTWVPLYRTLSIFYGCPSPDNEFGKSGSMAHSFWYYLRFIWSFMDTQ